MEKIIYYGKLIKVFLIMEQVPYKGLVIKHILSKSGFKQKRGAWEIGKRWDNEMEFAKIYGKGMYERNIKDIVKSIFNGWE